MLNKEERQLWAKWKEYVKQHDGTPQTSDYPGGAAHYQLSQFVKIDKLQKMVEKLDRKVRKLEAAK